MASPNSCRSSLLFSNWFRVRLLRFRLFDRRAAFVHVPISFAPKALSTMLEALLYTLLLGIERPKTDSDWPAVP